MTNDASPESRMRHFITAHYLDTGNVVPIIASRFPGGEVHVKALMQRDAYTNTGDVVVRAALHSSDAIMELLMATDAIRRQLHANQQVHLELPYLPYARQDRVCAPGEALSLRVMCNLLNMQRYASIRVADPHSDVAGALLDRMYATSQADILRKAKADRKMDFSGFTLVAPDAGALKKVGAVSQAVGRPYVRADKTRDPSTGAITGTVLVGEIAPDANLLIVDDICDGGRTFIELAKVLRMHTSGAICLYVTHGIFSKGVEVFDGLLDAVYVAHSFIDLPAREAWLTQFRSL